MKTCLVVALGFSLAAAAQVEQDGGTPDRPSEDAMFGDPGPTPPADRPEEAALFGEPDAGTEPSRDVEQLGGPAAQSRFDTGQTEDDPLTLGGMLYMRTQAAGVEKVPLERSTLSAPSLVDAYLDARPNERVRGYLLARMRYDALSDPTAGTSVFAEALGLPSAARPPNPSVSLDQLWVRFDVARTAFVTAGKQHVKWGAARFWNPTDFLSPERKDPLAVFDARLGGNMIKIHVPWEAQGWNFYAVGLLDNAGPATTLDRVGGAARAEVVLGQTELGADAVFVKGRRPRYGLDISSALGPVDVYGELAIRDGADFRLWRATGTIDASSPLTSLFEQYSPAGTVLLASGGLTYSFNYTEQNTLIVGLEYFHNPIGADTPLLYPWLLAQGQFQPFYAGRHYVGAYAVAFGLPGDLDQLGLTLSTLGNLSDLSFVSRLDVSYRALSYLSVEVFGAGHYGARGGEFRFGLDLPPLPLPSGGLTPPISVPAPTFEAGVGLRVSL